MKKFEVELLGLLNERGEERVQKEMKKKDLVQVDLQVWINDRIQLFVVIGKGFLGFFDVGVYFCVDFSVGFIFFLWLD